MNSAILQRLDMLNLYTLQAVVGRVLMFSLIMMLAFSVYVGHRGRKYQDLRYFHARSFCNWLWAYYFIAIIVFLAWVL